MTDHTYYIAEIITLVIMGCCTIAWIIVPFFFKFVGHGKFESINNENEHMKKCHELDMLTINELKDSEKHYKELWHRQGDINNTITCKFRTAIDENNKLSQDKIRLSSDNILLLNSLTWFIESVDKNQANKSITYTKFMKCLESLSYSCPLDRTDNGTQDKEG